MWDQKDFDDRNMERMVKVIYGVGSPTDLIMVELMRYFLPSFQKDMDREIERHKERLRHAPDIRASA